VQSPSTARPGEPFAPITVLTDSQQERPFAGYLAELFRVEGLNWVQTWDLARRPLAADTALTPLVAVSGIDVSRETAIRLAAHVDGGGSLLVARPNQDLAHALGVDGPYDLWEQAFSAYILLDETSEALRDLPWFAGGVQAFGRPAGYLVPEGSRMDVAAWLAPFAGQRTRFPAVLTGTKGCGRVALLAFDAAESAVLQQQGNPKQAGPGALPDFDGDGAFRATELFLGQLDPARRDVPQADLQRTLILRLMEWLTEQTPLPRVWRFPEGAPAAALFDGDSDSMAPDDLRLCLDTCDRYSAPFTTFLKPEHVEALDAGEERALRARGHSFGPHPWAGPQPSVAALRAALEENCAQLAAKYGYRPRIHRGHWVIWPGWVDHARSLAGAGIRLDTNFTAGRSFKGGYPNGSGLPLRFVDEGGAVLDVAEQSTISTDDGWLTGKNDMAALTLAEAITRSTRQIDEALERYHTVVHPYFHPVCLKGGRTLPYPTLPWLEAMLAHGKRQGMPFLHAEDWVEWNDARREISLEGYQVGDDGVSFTVRTGQALHGATVLVPVPDGAGPAVTVDGAPAEGEPTAQRHGRTYATATVHGRAGDTRRVTVRWR
jgi:hypothetical protein